MNLSKLYRIVGIPLNNLRPSTRIKGNFPLMEINWEVSSHFEFRSVHGMIESPTFYHSLLLLTVKIHIEFRFSQGSSAMFSPVPNSLLFHTNHLTFSSFNFMHNFDNDYLRACYPYRQSSTFKFQKKPSLIHICASWRHRDGRAMKLWIDF